MKEVSYGNFLCRIDGNKEVVNVLNGKRLGRIVDLIISSRSCRVLGLVVPGCKKFFKTKDDIFIPLEKYSENRRRRYTRSASGRPCGRIGVLRLRRSSARSAREIRRGRRIEYARRKCAIKKLLRIFICKFKIFVLK